MGLAYFEGGVPKKVVGTVRLGDFLYSAAMVEALSPGERADLGVVEYEPAGPLPAGQREVSTYLVRLGGAVVERRVLEPIPLPERKAAKLAALEVAYASALAIGYPKTFEGVPETLQCRNEHDRTNWLGLIEKCRFVISQGGGELPIDPPLRCTSNRKYAVTHVEAYAIMLEILNWVATVMGRYWDLKDAIEAAATNPELDAIDVTVGWP